MSNWAVLVRRKGRGGGSAATWLPGNGSLPAEIMIKESQR